MTAIILLFVQLPERSANFLARCVIVQCKNIIVAPEQIAESALIINGTFSTDTNAEKTLAISMKSGAPGG